VAPSTSAPLDVISYFQVHPALTARGHAAHALALLAIGKTDEARETARRAWRAGALPRPLEAQLLGSFGTAFGAADHDVRIDKLLAEGETAAALQIIPFGSTARRLAFETRVALQNNAADAATTLASVGAAANTDPGIVLAHASWLRKGGQSAAARALLAQPRTLSSNPANAKKWLETLLSEARGAAADRDWHAAYQIARQLDGIYPAEAKVAEQPLSERDDYTSLAWLAGLTALDKLNRPGDAAPLFEKYARGGRSGQVLTKGYYWAGRAALAAGQAEQANTYFEQGSAYPELFYGQLSLERLGRNVSAPIETATVKVAEADRNAFQRLGLVEAVRYLGQMGQWEDQSLFVRALAEHVSSDSDRALAAELSRQIARPDLGVWLARSARNEGTPFYVRAAYPEVQIPPAQAPYWSLAHGIIRQESSFDRAAVSHAGARGMMQLMPGTGREVAGQLGLPYDQARLTRDPTYNIMLGSHYFQNLMHYWGNNAALAAASYNAGSGNVIKWVRQNGDPRLPGADIIRWIEDIPFSETRGYVQRVLENAVVYDAVKQGSSPAESKPAASRLSHYLGKAGRPG
jgi:soluble lytic murein transglycosylase